MSGISHFLGFSLISLLARRDVITCFVNIHDIKLFIISIRYIVHNDVNNPTVSSLEEFDKLLSEFDPDLFVVSGLQMMDNYPFPEGITR